MVCFNRTFHFEYFKGYVLDYTVSNKAMNE